MRRSDDATRPPRALRALLVLALLAAAAAPAAAQSAGRELTRHERRARELLAELVGINTTHSVGDNTAAARAMAKRLLDAGFPAGDVHVLVPDGFPKKGNLVARLRGREGSGRKPILLLAHIDVVEANREDWTLPPFELVEKADTFYGRGVADDKDEAAIHVANLIRLKEEGYVPDRDIIVALTADEEGGTQNGVRWLLENRRELIEAAFALNEGGGGTLEGERRVSNNVQASEKKVLNLSVEATNPGGHSSQPRADNAIYDLAQALVGIRAHRFPVRLNEVTRAYFERSAPLFAADTGAAMRALLADPADERAVALLSGSPRFNSMLRTTCVATMLEGGHASNALPQRARATVNCRLLPDERPEDVQAALQRAAGSAVKVTMARRATDSPPSPLTPEVMRPVERITAEMWRGVPVLPTMSTGATDGLYLRNAGIPVYGVSGLFYGDTGSHGMNERVPVRSFYEGLEFLYRLVKAYTAPAS